MFRYEKAAAVGIASTPSGELDKDRLSRLAFFELIKAAVRECKTVRIPGRNPPWSGLVCPE